MSATRAYMQLMPLDRVCKPRLEPGLMAAPDLLEEEKQKSLPLSQPAGLLRSPAHHPSWLPSPSSYHPEHTWGVVG